MVKIRNFAFDRSIKSGFVKKHLQFRNWRLPFIAFTVTNHHDCQHPREDNHRSTPPPPSSQTHHQTIPQISSSLLLLLALLLVERTRSLPVIGKRPIQDISPQRHSPVDGPWTSPPGHAGSRYQPNMRSKHSGPVVDKYRNHAEGPIAQRLDRSPNPPQNQQNRNGHLSQEPYHHHYYGLASTSNQLVGHNQRTQLKRQHQIIGRSQCLLMMDKDGVVYGQRHKTPTRDDDSVDGNFWFLPVAPGIVFIQSVKSRLWLCIKEGKVRGEALRTMAHCLFQRKRAMLGGPNQQWDHLVVHKTNQHLRMAWYPQMRNFCSVNSGAVSDWHNVKNPDYFSFLTTDVEVPVEVDAGRMANYPQSSAADDPDDGHLVNAPGDHQQHRQLQQDHDEHRQHQQQPRPHHPQQQRPNHMKQEHGRITESKRFHGTVVNMVNKENDSSTSPTSGYSSYDRHNKIYQSTLLPTKKTLTATRTNLTTTWKNLTAIRKNLTVPTTGRIPVDHHKNTFVTNRQRQPHDRHLTQISGALLPNTSAHTQHVHSRTHPCLNSGSCSRGTNFEDKPISPTQSPPHRRFSLSTRKPDAAKPCSTRCRGALNTSTVQKRYPLEECKHLRNKPQLHHLCMMSRRSGNRHPINRNPTAQHDPDRRRGYTSPPIDGSNRFAHHKDRKPDSLHSPQSKPFDCHRGPLKSKTSNDIDCRNTYHQKQTPTKNSHYHVHQHYYHHPAADNGLHVNHRFQHSESKRMSMPAA